jgi:hypothetical protein
MTHTSYRVDSKTQTPWTHTSYRAASRNPEAMNGIMSNCKYDDLDSSRRAGTGMTPRASAGMKCKHERDF